MTSGFPRWGGVDMVPVPAGACSGANLSHLEDP